MRRPAEAGKLVMDVAPAIRRLKTAALTGALVAAGLALSSALCAAQQPAPAAPAQRTGFIDAVSNWFSDIGSTFKDAGKDVVKFGDKAVDAGRDTVNGAQDAATSVARIPGARVVSGHEKCLLAPNGAPDCNAAAAAMCKAKGLGSGKSLDMTTAEVCPPEVYLAGRRTGPGCTTDTFVSRALCQ